MKMCCNCEYFNVNYKLCERGLAVKGVIKCVFEHNIACKNYKRKESY